MSVISGRSTNSRDSEKDSDIDGPCDDRKSSAGRKTIADLVSKDPDKRNNRKVGIIAPHAPFETVRNTPADLQYDKFEKDEA